MKNKKADKSTLLPNLMIIVPAIALLAISTLTRTVWEWTSIWTYALTLLAAAPFLIPSTSMGKSIFASLPKFIPIAVLAMFLITAKYHEHLRPKEQPRPRNPPSGLHGPL